MEQRFKGRPHEQAYEYIKDLLLDGVRPPGSELRVEDVMSALTANRQPVMDAFKRLAQEGYVEVVPLVGCRVIEPDAREISDFFRLFSVTEGLAAEFAALRASAADRRALRAVHAEIAKLSPRDEPPDRLAHAYRTLNRRFHAIVHAMAQSVTVCSTAESFWDRSDFYISTAPSRDLVFARRITDAHAEHESILRAIDSGHAQAAHKKMEEHINAFARSCERASTELSIRRGGRPS